MYVLNGNTMELSKERWSAVVDFLKSGRYILYDIETTGLDPGDSRITAVCVLGRDGVKATCTPDEEALLEYLTDRVKGEHACIGYNNVSFDDPFIVARMLELGMVSEAEEYCINTYPVDMYAAVAHLHNHRVNLRNACKRLGVRMPWGDGKQAVEDFRAGRYARVLEHCISDVRALEDMYKVIVNAVGYDRLLQAAWGGLNLLEEWYGEHGNSKMKVVVRNGG